ncbi:MAG: type IV pilus biogenesis/stability protein PilW [Thiotrichales bacterium]
MLRVGLVALLLVWFAGCATTPDNESQAARSAELNVELGLDYLMQNRLDLAQIKLERALERDPELSRVNWAYALLQERLEKPRLAEKYYKRAISRDPKDAEALNNYGTFLCKQNRPEEAFRVFEKAGKILLYQKREVAYFNAGLCAVRQKLPARAEEYFKQSLEINPSYANSLYQMALLTYNQRRFLVSREYREQLREALGRDDPKLLWLCVVTERSMNNYTVADRCEKELKTRFPTSEEATSLY